MESMQPQSKRDKALSLALNVSETFCKGATSCGVVGVEIAAGLVLALILQLKAVKENADTCKELIAEISALTTLLDSVLDDIGRPRTEDERTAVTRLGSEKEFTTRVDGLRDALQKVAEEAKRLEVKNTGRNFKAVAKRFFSASPNKDRLKSMADTVKKATEDFKFRSGFAVEILVRDLKLKVERDQAEEATKAQLARDREEQLAREARERQERLDIEARERKERLDREARAQEAQRNERERRDAKIKQSLVDLRPANAPYSSRGHSGPLKDTCVAVMRDINEWATDPNQQPPFYVLTGGAGTGKSTVAYGVAESAHRRCGGEVPGQLAASFFFARGGAGLDSTDAVFQTLAAQMLSRIPSLRPFAIPIVEEYLALTGATNLAVQSEYLFEKLLAKLPNNHPPLLIVIDGVDECNAATQENVQLMLYLMLQCIQRVDRAVRVFVTSRPDVHIEHAFSSPPFVDASRPPWDVSLRRFRMHDIPRSVVDAEITQFFTTKLCGVGGLREAARDALFRNHPNAIQNLTTLSAGLFIYAATIVPYLLKHIGKDILRGVAPLFADEHKAPQSALERLGKLYAVVLEQALVGAPDSRSAVSAMIAVLGCIAVEQDHLSPDALAFFTEKDLEQDVLPTLHRLAPVLYFDPARYDVAVRPLHASFPEFLVDHDRCRPPYLVSEHTQHLQLAIHTLKLLTVPEIVKLYIGRLTPSGRSTSSVRTSPSEVVPSVMRYACIYWPAHVTRQLELDASDSDRVSESLICAYKEAAAAFFVPEHILQWIEVLGYLGNLSTALHWLPTLRRLFLESDKPLAETLDNAYQLVITFYPALVEDPRQVYISALPQSPDTSPFRTCISEALAVPRSLLPYPAWSPSVTRESELLPSKAVGYRWLIRPSPDGQWVAACFRSGRDRRGDIHLRDATTGIVVRTLRVHASGIVDFGISSDSRFIVSATHSGEICITNSSSGIPVVRYNHTDGDITRVAFRCKDSELLLVHTHREWHLDRPVHFLILDWERTEGELRPRWESHGLRYDPFDRQTPWSISPDGRWGIFWDTGDLLDLRSFAEVKLSFIPDWKSLGAWDARTCGTWLSPSLLVCSVSRKGSDGCSLGCSLIVVDIGQDIKEVETRAIRSVPAPYKFTKIEVSANGSLVALYDSDDLVFLWDPTGDEICFVKQAYSDDLCLSPHGDALYLAQESTWSVMPTSQSSIATPQPLYSSALKFSATRDTIIVATQRTGDHGSCEIRTLARGFSSSSGTAGVDSSHFFGHRPSLGNAALTPDPHSMIFPKDDHVLRLSVDGIKAYPDRSKHSRHKGDLTCWWYAAMSPDLSHIVACGDTPDIPDGSDQDLTFAVWDTESARLLHTFRTPQPFLPIYDDRRKEIIVTEALDIHFLLDHHGFVYRHSDWSTSLPGQPRVLPMPEPGPVPGEWFQIGNDGWVTRSDGHPEVGKRGRERLFWIPPSQRVEQLWRGDQHLLAMTTEYDVIVLDLSDFDDDTKEQHVPRLQIDNE